jgi:hypothetical protein
MRMVHDTVESLLEELRNRPACKLKPFKVVFDGEVKYTLSGNTDQAIAAVSRDLGMHVEALPSNAYLINNPVPTGEPVPQG